MTIIIDDTTAYDYFKSYFQEYKDLWRQQEAIRAKIGYVFLKGRQRRILDAREYKILCMRFGTGRYYKTHTLEQVAKEFNVTRERIRQMEPKALSKLAKLHHTEVEINV